MTHEAQKFCWRKNILYSRSPIQQELEQNISWKLSQHYHNHNIAFRTVDWEKQIEEIIVEIDGVQLTYHYGWKNPHGYFVGAPSNVKAANASLRFFITVANINNSDPNRKLMRIKHAGCIQFYPNTTAWELVNYKIL